MYCNNCGNQIPDGQTVCNNCGAATGNANQYNYTNAASAQAPYQGQTMAQGQAMSQGQAMAQGQAAPMMNKFVPRLNITYMQDGMKWYLFLIWGYLIYLVLSSFRNGITMFRYAGKLSNYSDDLAEAMAIWCGISGVLMILYGLYAIRARKLLIEFRARALVAIKIVFLLPLAIIVITYLIVLIKYDVNFFDYFMYMFQSDAIILVCILALYLVVAVGSIIYIGNRRNMFIY